MNMQSGQRYGLLLSIDYKSRVVPVIVAARVSIVIVTMLFLIRDPSFGVHDVPICVHKHTMQ